MAQFVRKNIDIISSTSRPTTSDVPPLTPPDHLNDASWTVELTSTIHGPLSALLFENYTFMPKSADPDFSSQSFRTALESYHNDHDEHTLPLMIGSSTTVATIPAQLSEEHSHIQSRVPDDRQLTSFHQLPSGYESIGEIYVDTGRAQSVLWTGKQILKNVKKLFGSEPEGAQPPLRTPDELERQPLLPRDPDDPDNETSYPEWYARLLTVPQIYLILGVIVVAILFLIMIITGDPTLLFLAIRGAVCYLLGSTISGLLFGDSFCPIIEVAKNGAGATAF